MTSLCIRTEPLYFPETCQKLIESIEFLYELVGLFCPPSEYVPTSHWFYSEEMSDDFKDIEDISSDDLGVLINLCGGPLTAMFYPEDEFWLLSMMFDHFPFHSVEVPVQTALIFPWSTPRRILFSSQNSQIVVVKMKKSVI